MIATDRPIGLCSGIEAAALQSKFMATTTKELQMISAEDSGHSTRYIVLPRS